MPSAPGAGNTYGGNKGILGFSLSKHEGAELRMGGLTGLKNREANDLYIACMDGLRGFPDAVRVVFPIPGASYAVPIWCAPVTKGDILRELTGCLQGCEENPHGHVSCDAQNC